jgi:transposase
MYIKPSYRHNRQGKKYVYYRLSESYKDAFGFSKRRDLINIGRLDDFTLAEVQLAAMLVTEKASGKSPQLFVTSNLPSKVVALAEDLYSRLIAQRLIDVPGSPAAQENTIEELRRQQEFRFLARVSTLRHTEVREIGAEHLCVETMKMLKMSQALRSLGFTEDETALAVTQIAIRAVHPASELATSKWIRNNSDICRLTGFDESRITKDLLYKSAIKLYNVRDELKDHLSKWTKELFDYDDNLILYDLTNVYAEGDYGNSRVWDYGRSKEKRNDCKLIVLALVVNQYGFPKHYQLFHGRMQDTASFKEIIDTLDAHMQKLGVCPTVVMDAGISTEENLSMLRKRSYKFLCVSRSSSKVYKPIDGETAMDLEDRMGQPISIQKVEVVHKPDKSGNLPDSSSDTYYWVRSEAKAAKENGMYDQFTRRFIAELEKIQASLSKKHGTKKVDKVNERIGRAKGKYPSVAKYYDISYTEDGGTVTSLAWKLKDDFQPDQKAGVYFLQTNLDGKDSRTVWTIYNILKEVESSFRCMKSDLNLRPVFHKNDIPCLAHLHLGVLAYWVVATIRYELKQKKFNRTWSQILDIMMTQKSVASTMQNLKGEDIHTQQCSEPNEQVVEILDKVKIRHVPYKPIKSVRAQIDFAKINTTENEGLP